MNAVITQQQAKQITEGREPFGIAEYEQAVGLLRQCLTIDDAQRFATFADAKAAWAKVHHNNDALRLSRALKLYAAKRMAEIAEKERPTLRGSSITRGRKPGAQSLLMESGMSRGDAIGARYLAKLSPSKFRALVGSKKPLALSSLLSHHSDLGKLLGELASLHAAMKSVGAEEAVEGIRRSKRIDGERVRLRVTEVSEWCDEFLQRYKNER